MRKARVITLIFKLKTQYWLWAFAYVAESIIFALLLTTKVMAVTRLKRKNRKDKSKSAVRRQSLKIQNAKPVIKNVDIEKIKEAFKAKKA
ncbi:MAG: hypothetical protein KF725_08610 [Cyclobacteriaceae bacterium]|nr:hypothetical protein [Cyclobacteriaceae bacterium]UYN88633.1 MAG: hypothetical protein KIT51_07105 [Cyclobacteriaceae bacterium]